MPIFSYVMITGDDRKVNNILLWHHSSHCVLKCMEERMQLLLQYEVSNCLPSCQLNFNHRSVFFTKAKQ